MIERMAVQRFFPPALVALLASSSALTFPAALASGLADQGADKDADLVASSTKSEIESSIDALANKAIERWERIDNQAIADLLDQFFSAQLAAKDADSKPDAAALESVFRVTSSASAATPSVASRLVDVSEMLVVAASDNREAEKRIPAATVAQNTYDLLINAREFQMAQEFARRHGLEEVSWIEGLAPIVPSQHARYLAFHRSGDKVVASLADADLHKGEWLVVEIHPDCAFSRRALDYLSQNRNILSEINETNILWVVSQSRGQAVPSMMTWNDENSDFEMVLSFENEHWPAGISFLEYPVFNLVRDGQVVQKLQGWPGDHQAESLLDVIHDFVAQ